MNHPEKTPSLLAHEAHEDAVLESPSMEQEHFTTLDEEGLEEITGAKNWFCCIKLPRTNSISSGTLTPPPSPHASSNGSISSPQWSSGHGNPVPTPRVLSLGSPSSVEYQMGVGRRPGQDIPSPSSEYSPGSSAPHSRHPSIMG